MEELKTAQYVIKTSNSSVSSGFNQFVYGHDRPMHHECHDFGATNQGYEYAEKMAKQGKLAFIKKFKCSCGDIPFLYGGFWVCNGCGGKGVDKEWWKIKVEKDGNEYCCHGLDFINLQESNYYAFGETFEIAIKNYEELMIGMSI